MPFYPHDGAALAISQPSVARSEGMTGTVMRREHDFEYPRYVIAWGDGEQSEIWPNEDPDLEERLELLPVWPKYPN
jgi:hypothetical protein